MAAKANVIAMAEDPGLDPQEALALAPRSAPMAPAGQPNGGGFRLAPAPGEDNDAYAKAYADSLRFPGP
jgi:hypothetical protein